MPKIKVFWGGCGFDRPRPLANHLPCRSERSRPMKIKLLRASTTAKEVEFAATMPPLDIQRLSVDLISRMGPCSRTPSGPAVSIDCINRPDRRLHPTNATASIYLLQRGSHPQRTQVGHRAMSVSCRYCCKSRKSYDPENLDVS